MYDDLSRSTKRLIKQAFYKKLPCHDSEVLRLSATYRTAKVTLVSKDDDIARFFGGNAAAAAGAADASGTDSPAAEPDFTLDPPIVVPSDEEAAARVEAEEEADGEIAVDVYQTESDVVVVSPIAGVTVAEVAFTDDSVTIAGERTGKHLEQTEDVLVQEIFWGSFSRTVTLPVPCDVDKATHSFKDGVLTVTIPKVVSKAKKRVIKVKGTK